MSQRASLHTDPKTRSQLKALAGLRGVTMEEALRQIVAAALWSEVQSAVTTTGQAEPPSARPAVAPG
jgi:hypothetical protein